MSKLSTNSLIEFEYSSIQAIEKSKEVGEISDIPHFEPKYHKDSSRQERYLQLKSQIAHTMNNCSGIIRSELLLSTGLNLVKKELRDLGPEKNEYYDELSRKLLTIAFLIMTGARFRRESRGGHYREDYPTLKEEFAVHTIQQKDKELKTKKVNEE